MKISLVIPTYNGQKYIEQTIQSILNQTRPADEIIISDDNSTDRTIEICNKYKDQIKIFQNPTGPSGFVNGWNNAIKHATCDYISILHQDDILASNFLEEIESAHKLHPDVKQIVSICNYIDCNGNIIRESTHFSNNIKRYTGSEYNDIYILKGYDHINRCPGVVTHREIFNYCIYRAESGHIADDDFFIRVGNFTDIVCIHKPLAFYREHASSETGHLDYLELNLRLLNDHSFQIKEFPSNPILSKKAQDHLREWETKYMRRIFFYSIKTFHLSYTTAALISLLKAIIRDRGRNIKYLLRK